MPITTPLSPQPRIPSPPSARDFEIHRLNLVEFLSTRHLAEKFNLSQTRIRQIVARVAEWLTEMLPIKSEQDIEKEKRYAIHLAAAQLQHQIQELQNFWDGTSDPKYFRQQARTIVALSRLGVSSTTLDSLAATAIPDEHTSNELPSTATPSSSSFVPSPSTIPPSQISNPKSEIPNSSPLTPDTNSSAPSSFSLHNSSFPPSEDCSLSSPSSLVLRTSSYPSDAANSQLEHDLYFSPTAVKDTLAGLDIMEKRLLSMIDETYPDQPERLASLNETLSDIRQSRANFVLQLGPNLPVTPPKSDPAHQSYASVSQADVATQLPNPAPHAADQLPIQL